MEQNFPKYVQARSSVVSQRGRGDLIFYLDLGHALLRSNNPRHPHNTPKHLGVTLECIFHYCSIRACPRREFRPWSSEQR